MPTKTYVVTVADVKREDARFGGAASGLMMDDQFVKWTWLEGGTAAETFRPAYDQMTYVMEGRTAWRVDGEEYAVGAGEVLYIPAGADRSVSSDAPARVLEVYGGLPWEFVDLVEHQVETEYRDWVLHNP
jgi:ethanolamine utilization protein EutQ (cupin superfamily)